MSCSLALVSNAVPLALSLLRCLFNEPPDYHLALPHVPRLARFAFQSPTIQQ